METIRKFFKRVFYFLYFYEKWGMGLERNSNVSKGGPEVASGFVLFAFGTISILLLISGISLLQYGLVALAIYIFGQLYYGKSTFFDYLTASALFCMMFAFVGWGILFLV